jgi:O-antigen/teichoic acid export membrane protein
MPIPTLDRRKVPRFAEKPALGEQRPERLRRGTDKAKGETTPSCALTTQPGRKAMLALMSNLAGAALGYLALLLIGRYFAPDAYGSYLFAMSATGILALASNLGIGTAHQRHVAQGTDPGRALGVLVRLRLLFSLAAVAVVALAYGVWWLADGGVLTDATTPMVLAMALLMQVLSGSRQVLLDTWAGQQRVNRVEAVRQLDTLLVLLLLGNAALLLAHLTGRWEVVPGVGSFWADQLGLSGPLELPQQALLLAGCYIVAKTVSLLLAWTWSLRDRVRLAPWDRALARSYLRLARPFALMGALVVVLQYTDTIMLGFFWTDHEVGLYGTAQKLASVCLLGAGAVGAVLFPRFAQLHSEGDHQATAATFTNAQRYLMLLVVPLAAAMAALAPQGVHIAVGDPYLGAALPLRFLALWALVISMEQPMSSRFMSGGHASLLVRSTTLTTILNVLLNLVLIPRGGIGLGPTGAAIATLAATSVSYVYLRAQSHRIHGVPWVDGHQVRIGLAGLAAGVFWLTAPMWAGAGWFDRVWELLGWGVAGGLLYIAVLALVGEVRRSDMEFLRKVTHPRALLAEMKGR